MCVVEERAGKRERAGMLYVPFVSVFIFDFPASIPSAVKKIKNTSPLEKNFYYSPLEK